MGALEGKVAVVTGGNSGIGFATAERFVDEGAYVFITARRQAELDRAAAAIGRNVATVAGDLSKLEDIDRIAASVKTGKGIVDIIVSNAGFTEQASLDTLTPEHFDKTFNLMARAPVFVVQKLLPMMSRGGSIILVSSAMHVMGIPNHTAYAATKAATRSYARTWAAEFKDRGIRVNTPPVALDRDGLAAIRNAFAAAARRASRLGLDFIEILGGHGYLIHQFLSPLSNRRDDEYGGSLENRMRFPLEVFEAVRAAFALERPVTMRVSGTDWVEGGWSIEETIAFVEALQARGAAAINVSSGGSTPSAQIPVGPGYQLSLARAVKQATTLPVIAVGMITDFEQAESILRSGDADLIALARAMPYDPRWPWHAAAHFGTQIRAPKQYLRSQPTGLRNLFL